MRLQEYETKEIFNQYNIPIPPGKIARSATEAKTLAEEIGLPIVIKAQVLVGGRGKAGGIKIAETLQEVTDATNYILNLDIKGYQSSEVLLYKKIDIQKELYCSVTIDRTIGWPVIMISSDGGINIEDIAKKSPDKIFKLYCNPLSPLYSFQVIDLVRKLGYKEKLLLEVSRIVEKLFCVFKQYDGIIAEINPLVITEDGDLSCIDAVFEVDDAALFRHPSLEDRKFQQMNSRLQRLDKKGATYVQLEGNIGLICSGAGLAVATRTLAKRT